LRRKNTAALSKDEQRLTASLAEAIGDGRVVMIGPIRQELLSGIKDRAQFDKLKHALQVYSDEPLDTGDYEHAAHFYNVCRSRGIECGPVDILICAVAARRKWLVLANDNGLSRCFEIVRAVSP
jgi:predicted nucleic acid-binding protein